MNKSAVENFATLRLLRLTDPKMQGEDVTKVQQAANTQTLIQGIISLIGFLIRL